MAWTIFDYFYRDAGNHKAFGSVVLEGHILKIHEDFVVSQFDGEARFVAEQIRVPVLYDQLYRWSGGPTIDDHCWHECLGFRKVGNNFRLAGTSQWGTVGEFVALIGSVEFWDDELSPHFYIGAPIQEAISRASF